MTCDVNEDHNDKTLLRERRQTNAKLKREEQYSRTELSFP
jgi:hypothetical protein